MFARYCRSSFTRSMMLSLILLIATPWLAFCMPPPTSKTLPPPPTTTPPMCTCSDGTQIAPGEYHSISDCHTCYCDDNYHEAQEMIADCLPSNCVDPIDVTGQCCSSCPNGANCKADFIDINGKPRSELISARDGVVDFGTARCKCDYNNFYDGEPRAICELMPQPTTLPAMCTCSDGTPVQPGQSVWITPCRGCYCDENNLEAYETIADCFMTPCVDSVRKPDQCCPECPNGHNCRAEFVDEYGVKRNEIISVSDDVVKFNSTECQCDYNNYHGEPKALCVLTLSIEPVTAEQTTIP